MDIVQIVVGLHALAQGFHPQSGEVLEWPGAEDPAVLRVLYEAALALKRMPPERRAPSDPARVGAPWSEDEEAELVERFKSAEDFIAIATAHQRTKGGIISRLKKLGLVGEH